MLNKVLPHFKKQEERSGLVQTAGRACVGRQTLALCATAVTLFVSRRYRQLCAAFLAPPDLSLLHFTSLWQKHRRVAFAAVVNCATLVLPLQSAVPPAAPRLSILRLLLIGKVEIPSPRFAIGFCVTSSFGEVGVSGVHFRF